MEPWTPRVVLVPDAFTASEKAAPRPLVWGASVTRVASTDEAARRLAEQDADLLLVERSLPVSDPSPYEQLARDATDCDLVQHLGPWCEGEERTGVTIEGFHRVFWHAWSGWWRRWLADFRGERTIAEPLAGATIALAADADASHALGAVLAERGACCVRLGELPHEHALIGNPAAIVWNGSQLGGMEAERLRSCCEFAREREAPLIALLDFPRPETVDAAKAVGVGAVLGKPCDGHRLCEAIRDAIVRRKARAGRRASRSSDSPTAEAESTRAAA